MRRAIAMAAAVAIAGGPFIVRVARAADAGGAPARIGAFAAPIEEPNGHTCAKAQDPAPKCKPAAVSMAVLPTGDVLYWDGLEGMNNVKYSTALEFGHTAQNDQSRLLDLSGPTWRVPDPEDSGVNPNGNPSPRYLPGVPHSNENTKNDGDLFCSSFVQMSDGTVLTAGGTDYYQEPAVPGTNDGLVELEGLANTRIYDDAANTWRQSGPMNHGRWYPSVVTLPDGKLLVVGGVGKMIKPVYSDHPDESGRNNRTTETYDPATGRWTDNGPTAKKSLPLFPRVHVLPDGEVLAVNGADTDEVVFPGSGHPVPQAELFDPATKKWTPAATDPRNRSYHSTAALLPDGRVLVAGHAPINTGYGGASDTGRDNLGLTAPESDPTFSIYSPPYLFRGDRPVITAVNRSVPYDQLLTIGTTYAKDISTVALVRNPSVTHLVDGDQRTVDVPVVSRTADSVTVSIPGNTVLPPGPYMLFVNRNTAQGEIPSMSRQVFLGRGVPASLAARLTR